VVNEADEKRVIFDFEIDFSHIGWTASPLNKNGHWFYSRIRALVARMDGERPIYLWFKF
jgi:hypothetical protein